MGDKPLPQAFTGGVKSKGDGVQLFQSCIRPIQWLTQVLSLVPYRYNKEKKQYELSWCTWAAWRTVFTAVYLTVLVAASVTGMVMLISRGGTAAMGVDENSAAISLAGVILVMQCLLNAWVQLLCTLGTARRMCRLANSWCSIAANTTLNITRRMKLVILRQLTFLAVFWSVIITLTLLEYPVMLLDILDALGHNMFLLPSTWTTLPSPMPLVLRTQHVINTVATHDHSLTTQTITIHSFYLHFCSEEAALFRS